MYLCYKICKQVMEYVERDGWMMMRKAHWGWCWGRRRRRRKTWTQVDIYDRYMCAWERERERSGYGGFCVLCVGNGGGGGKWSELHDAGFKKVGAGGGGDIRPDHWDSVWNTYIHVCDKCEILWCIIQCLQTEVCVFLCKYLWWHYIEKWILFIQYIVSRCMYVCGCN